VQAHFDYICIISFEDCLSREVDGSFDPAPSVDVNRYLRDSGGTEVISYTMCQNQNGAYCTSDLAYVVRHPNYVPFGMCQNPAVTCGEYDFALIFLPEDRPVTTVTPVTLNADLGVPSVGQQVEAMGWGGGSTDPNFPWTVNLPTISTAECDNFYTQTTISAANQLCAWDRTGTMSTCGGDSGECSFESRSSSQNMIGLMRYLCVIELQ